MARTDLPRLAILGAGPIGLEAALCAAILKLPFTLYERGRVGEHLHRWGHVRLFSPFGANSTPLGRERLRAELPSHRLPGDGELLTGREHVAAYLEPLANLPSVRDHLRTGVEVRHIGRRGLLKGDLANDARRAAHPFRLLLREGKAERAAEADVVLDCTGTYGQHRWLGDGGVPALGEVNAEAQIAYGLDDVHGDKRQTYADRTVLVVGSGYSAATVVCQLADLSAAHPATWVIWLARGPKSQPIRRFVNDALRERDQLAVRANQLATRGDGNVEFHPQTAVEAVEWHGSEKGFTVRGRGPHKETTWQVDRILAQVGSSPDTTLFRELHVAECYLSLSPIDPATGAASLRGPEPHFFILGARSHGRNSSFLLKVGFDQVREAFALLVGSADLQGRFPALRQCPKLSG